MNEYQRLITDERLGNARRVLRLRVIAVGVLLAIVVVNRLTVAWPQARVLLPWLSADFALATALLLVARRSDAVLRARGWPFRCSTSRWSW